jgi:hypothetical protein
MPFVNSILMGVARGWGPEETRLDDFGVDGCRLLHKGAELFRFPTPISSLARLGDVFFVILHPYPASKDRFYAGTNLWAISTNGEVLWKAPNLNPRKLQDYSYYGLIIYDHDAPKVRVQWDDRAGTVLDAFAGQPLPELLGVDPIDVAKQTITRGTVILVPQPHTPPERSQLPDPSETAQMLLRNGRKDAHVPG